MNTHEMCIRDRFYGSSFSDEAYEHARQTLTDPDSKWSKLINCVLDQTAPNVARTMALNLGYEAFFRGTKTIRENREMCIRDRCSRNSGKIQLQNCEFTLLFGAKRAFFRCQLRLNGDVYKRQQ